MNDPRRLMTVLLIVVMSPVSCSDTFPTDWVTSTGWATTAEDHSLRLSSSLPDADALAAAQVMGALHTGLMPEEVARLGVAIVTESRRSGIPMELVLALIQVESSGNAFAVSSVGAIGLMQLRPSTAEEVAAQLGIRWTGAAMLFEPVTNVRLGVEYLRQLVERYGSVSTALAAYNWGPGRIGNRLRRGETIPAHYADKVIAKYRQPLYNAI
jgi:soluble lytic murein transglycosylase-like protein